mgnify:FL=1
MTTIALLGGAAAVLAGVTIETLRELSVQRKENLEAKKNAYETNDRASK